jgi:hypothetical protein
MIGVKNNLRQFQKNKTYTPPEDIEHILKWLEQLEQQSKK